MRFAKLMVMTSVLALSSLAQAGAVSATGVPSVMTSAAEGYYFSVGTTPSTGCSSSNYVIQSGYPNFKTAVAAIMMAYNSGKPISVVSDGTCYNGRPNIIYVTNP